MDLPWWVWVLVALGAALLLGARAARGWRASVRGELLAYLREHAPDVEVVAERDRELELRVGGEVGTAHLGRLFEQATHIPVEDAAARQPLYEAFVKMLGETAHMVHLGPADAARLRPRLLPDAVLASMQSRLGKPLAALPSGVPGLSVVLVLDNEASVAYVTLEHLVELELALPAAAERATDNLAPSLPASVVRGSVEGAAMNVLKSLDTYDAARVLLVPRHLAAGESLVALIPDRDTLVLTAPPPDGDWSGLRRLAGVPSAEALWPDPLLVTAEGLSAVAGR